MVFTPFATAQIEVAKSLLILNPPKHFEISGSKDPMQHHLNDLPIHLFGEWSEDQKATLERALAHSKLNRTSRLSEVWDLNVLRVIGFKWGHDFSVQEKFDHLGSGKGIWGGRFAGLEETTITLALDAKDIEIAEFLKSSLPSLVCQVHLLGYSSQLAPIK